MGDFVFLRKRAMHAMTGLSETSMSRAKDFPAPVRIGPRQVAWIKSEVEQWMARRVHESRGAAMQHAEQA